MHYRDKAAVITGAGSGIGRALAVELARRGAKLAISDINDDALAETAALCERAGGGGHKYHLDVADRQAVLAHAEQVAHDLGGVNLVVNNAGVALMATVEEMSWEDLDWLMGINFWGVIHGTKAFLPHLIASGDGHLVNVSSVFGFIGVPSQSAYNAAKFGVRGFTEALRQEMLIAGHPVAVSCVHPGGIKTNIARDARAARDLMPQEQRSEQFERAARTTPEKAAQIILRGVDRKKARILVGPDAYVFDAIPRVTGSGYQRIGASVAKWATKRAGVEL
ncbi:MAG TPA: SDR family NAD(P)-dependent oxidoreductase [Mycobacteriales bacterium]|nr:SDR family NAD(P)-dependent oxidoreductase [Mycobacteriales bacterium]